MPCTFVLFLFHILLTVASYLWNCDRKTMTNFLSVCVYRAALLVSQAGGGGSAGRLVQEQLNRWTEVGADRHIDPGRLGLYSLVAGQAVHAATAGPVNTCRGLDWKRSLALHLW
jgi:hypothetical protein